MNCYSPAPPPIPIPSNLRLIVALCPAQPPSYYVLSVFVSSYSKVIFSTIEMPLARTNDVSRCPCTNTRQSTPLAGKMCYLLVCRLHTKEITNVERVGHGQGRSESQTSPRFRPLLCCHCFSVVQNIDETQFWRWLRVMIMNPYGDTFCHTLGDFLACWVSQGEVKWRRNKPFSPSWDNVLIIQK